MHVLERFRHAQFTEHGIAQCEIKKSHDAKRYKAPPDITKLPQSAVEEENVERSDSRQHDRAFFRQQTQEEKCCSPDWPATPEHQPGRKEKRGRE